MDVRPLARAVRGVAAHRLTAQVHCSNPFPFHCSLVRLPKQKANTSQRYNLLQHPTEWQVQEATESCVKTNAPLSRTELDAHGPAAPKRGTMHIL